MARKLAGLAAAWATVGALCLTVAVAEGQPRGNAGAKSKSGAGAKPGGGTPGGARSGGAKPGAEKPAAERSTGAKPAGPGRSGAKAPGGAWSDHMPQSGAAGRGQAAEGRNRSAGAGEKGAAAEHAEGERDPRARGEEGAAAGVAASRKNSGASGKEGAAAGAAAANRRGPAATGAEGAAAGAAAANRRGPAATGAQGAAAGAAAVNRNQPAASGAEGAAVGAAAAKRNQPAVSGAEGAAVGAAAANRNQTEQVNSARYATVRNTFNHPNVYNPQWYAGHPTAWATAGWAAGAAWTPTNYAGAATYLGYGNAAPISYGYGNNVVYQQGNVMIDGQNAGSAEDFSQQAADLALAGHDAPSADTDDWMPLGVFALVRNADQHAQTTVQLAINLQGILRGNYTDTVTDHTQQIQGSVDKDTQRAAWTIGDNKNYFMEAGLKNLTDGEAPALMHKYGRTEQWLLIRLEQPHPEGPLVDQDPAE